MRLVKTILFQTRFREGEPAIAFSGGITTYGGLAKAVEAAVEALQALALQPGAIVMLDIRNPVHHTAMIFGLALLGLPSASAGSGFGDGAGLLPDLFLTDRDDISSSSFRVLRIDDRWFASEAAHQVDYTKLLALPGFASPDEIVRYVYSSGTTGHPKCVALTERCLEERIGQGGPTLSWSVNGPAGLNMMGFSTIVGIMAPLVAHLRGVILCYAGSPDEALQMVQVFRVAVLALAVGQLPGFLDRRGDGPPLPNLRLLTVAGAKLTPRLLAEARARLCANIWVGYGSTEMGGMSTGPAASIDHHPDSAGYILPWVEMEAIGDDGRPVPAGEEGILRVRAPGVAFYVDAQGRSVDMYTDGWFYPGDIGRIHADGLLTVTGRTNEVINRGGVIVAPEVIEEVLRLDRRLSDVAVVGVPGGNGLEQIWAAVVAETPIDGKALIEASRPRLSEKAPDRIIQLTAIPRNVNSKIQRNLLREQLLAEAGGTGR
jgi:acyl-coenzyme A synthetase/AMP-(fatty) acid ligase